MFASSIEKYCSFDVQIPEVGFRRCLGFEVFIKESDFDEEDGGNTKCWLPEYDKGRWRREEEMRQRFEEENLNPEG
ncbi:hypothetical protein L2E82_23226 [Cichorium intybus]|uniref:Uncharacterized protein n=1 Tax=Cichorium intybus TaxID=13427 RepID=A0ACB9E0H7_CICIN|nr:hypothetical protein L2E82_23226 [Cichorium intybus]